MAANARSKLVREERMNRTLELYLRGQSYSQIAKALPAAKSTVAKDIAAIREEWRRSRSDELGHALLMELARIDAMERECWAQWEASKTEEVITRAETGVEVGKDATGRQVRTPISEKVIRSTRLRNADPRYMDTIRWCVEQRCKLLGLLAPNGVPLIGKVALTAPDGVSAPKVSLDLSDLSDEELDVLDRMRDRMMGLPASGKPSLN